MKKRGIYAVLALLTVSLSSCWKKEEPFVLPPQKAGVKLETNISLGSTYDKMFYYNLNDQTYEMRELADWDVAFEASANGFHAIVNGGKDISVLKTPNKDFAASFTIDPGAPWKHDATSGNLDSTAFGEELADANGAKQDVYILDMSVNYPGERYKKLQVTKADANGYDIRVADLSTGANEFTLNIPKQPTTNFVYADLTEKKVRTNMEPDKNDWDIVFTRYKFIYYDYNPPLPYLVTGVLVNPNKVQAYQERDKKFEDINLSYAKSLTFSGRHDEIGFEWKSYNQTAGKYTVDKTRTYIIKSVKGNYFKLHFIDFYDNNGVKGTPIFEFQEIIK